MFQSYYQNELAYLRDMGRAFAAEHPAVAGMLAERSGDPDVERLLEGFAFVAARLRQRVDSSLPELIETLTELLLPHFVRPTPATTIVAFDVPHAGGRGARKLPAGAALETRPVRGTSCSFRTTRDLTLLPLTLLSQRLDDSSASRPELRLTFELDPAAREAVFSTEGIRFYLHGELTLTTQLYLWFSRHVSAVSLTSDEGRTVELSARSVRPVGFDGRDALFPWPAFSSQAARLLLEYATLAPKFLFLDIQGLDRAAHMEGARFELTVRFSRPPPLPSRMPEGTLRLHCVPAVNLFSTSADPVRTDITGRPVLLRGAELDPMHSEIFSVDHVVGMSPARDERRQYLPFHSFEHALPEASHPGFYKLTRERSPVDDGLHTFIRVDHGPKGPPLLHDETLSVEVTCTNRSLCGDLQLGDVCSPTADTPSGVSFVNIAPVSRATRPPLGTELSFQFISHLAATRRSLGDLGALKAFLHLYNPQEQTDHPAARTHGRRIDAIRDVRARTITRVVRGAALRGTLYHVEVEREGFASDGDAYLFGAVLHAVLDSQASLNTFADLELSLTPTRQSFRFHGDVDHE